MQFGWPLTGRSQEMGLIEAALSDPASSGIVVCGSAGAGKSRIAREALAGLASRGWEVRWAVGTTSARALPLGALASWAGSTGSDTLQLVRGVIDALASAPQGTPVVVGVDDVHLLDDLSVFVLHQIVQRRAAKLVLTVRDGEPIPAGVQEVWKAGPFERLDVQPLSRDETETLLSATLGGPLDPGAAQRLWHLTYGNVLYLRNIVEHEVEGGRLGQHNGVWRWFGDPVMPPSLIEMIESRMGTLPPSVGDVIDALAVGEPLELAVLTRITDPAAVEEADARGLITLEPGEDWVEVRVAHPLYGEVRRERAPATRLRRLNGLVATELARCGGDDMRLVVRCGTLSLDSDLAPDADLLVRAAKGAVWLADLPLADRLAEAAIRAGGGVEANFVRAHALSWLSRGAEADAVLADIPQGELGDADWGRLIFQRVQNMLFTLADPTGAKALIDHASHTARARADRYIQAILTVYWALMGKPGAARNSYANVELGKLPAVADAGTAMAFCVASGDVGCTAEAVSAANAAYDIAHRSFDAAHMRFVIADGHIGALLQSGRIEEAGDTAERLRRQAADLPGAQLMSSALAGMAALGAGRLDKACGLLELAVDAMSDDTVGWGYRYQLPRTIALSMRGLTDECAVALDTLEKRRHPSWRYLDYEFGIAQAWVAACQGAVDEAIRTVLAAAELARANGQFAAELSCLQAATQFGDRSCEPRLDELKAIVEGPRVGVVARFAAALRAGDGAELAAVSEEFERMGDLVAAVDAAAHAAIVYRCQGMRGPALSCSTRAQALAERCGGANTPALRQASEPLPLTDREREIVMLLAEGMSNRDVAARLSLSIRTVESHIYRAMAKTGTTSRDDLAALLPPRAPRPYE